MYKRYQDLVCTVEPEIWVKLLIRIRERIEMMIVYITIIFVSVLVGFIIAVLIILAHITWALAWEWAVSIGTAKTVTWALTRGSGHLPGILSKPDH